jgi:outer membrane protein assembly factor BamA
MKTIVWSVALLFFSLCGMGQQVRMQQKASEARHDFDTATQKDAHDILRKWLGTTKPRTALRYNSPLFSILPGINYTATEGFSVTLSANLVYYASPARDQNLSTLYTSAGLAARHQVTFSAISNLWMPNNRVNFSGELWGLNAAENTYGLGGNTQNKTKNQVDYRFLRVYESALFRTGKDMYVGPGYQLDYHYNIFEHGTADGSLSDLDRYTPRSKTVSSGPSLNFLYDTRRNSINPYHGAMVSVVYSPKFTFLGSDANWQSLKVDLRRYIATSPYNHNVLAFWGLMSFTLSGAAPYLDLPGTGWDDAQRTGRGYAQGRYRGRNMLYAESEYRFGLTENGLLGGVVFANAQSFSQGTTGSHFTTILPAVGTGIRVKLNKYSRTNLCLDYAVGLHGSNTLLFNLGEVF